MKNIFMYQTLIGDVIIEENANAISKCSFGGYGNTRDAIIKETPLLMEASKQLNEYLSGQRQSFDLPLAPMGTVFQMKIWNYLRTIPYGETQSYGEVAEHVGQAKASRAVGNANNKNPMLIFIPCHRILGAKGDLVGYAGGLDKKEFLLNLEKKYAKC